MRGVERSYLESRHVHFRKNKKGAARIRAAPHLSLVPERLQLALPAPSVVIYTPLPNPLPQAGEGANGSLREYWYDDTLQIRLFRLVLEPERLRVLRLRRCCRQHTLPVGFNGGRIITEVIATDGSGKTAEFRRSIQPFLIGYHVVKMS